MRYILPLLCLLLFAAPAAAATPVLTTPGGATLSVADKGADQLALTLNATATLKATEAGVAPLWPDEWIELDAPDFSPDGSSVRLVAGGAVEADVATVEFHWKSGKVLRLNTFAGYGGRHDGQVRFFAGEIALTTDEWGDPAETRLLDAGGALVAVHNSEATSRRVTLTHRGGVRFGATLTAFVSPLPADPTHRAQELCLTVGGNDDAACQDDPASAENPLRLGGVRGCGGRPSTLAGFVPAATRTVLAVLGDGRSVRFPTRATPFGRAERVVIGMVARGMAIRSVSALDAQGHVVMRGDVAVAPPDRRCDDPGRNWNFLSDYLPTRFGTPPGTQTAVGHLVVRDLGDQLCDGIDVLALDGSDCGTPPVDSRLADLHVHHYPGGVTSVSGVYAAKVVRADVTLDSGAHLFLPVTAGTGYTGRFAGQVHFLYALLPAEVKPVIARLLDANDQPIGTAVGDECGCHDGRSLHPLLRAGRYELDGRGTGDGACVALAPSDDCAEFVIGKAEVDAFVTCAPRQTVIYGLTPHSVPRVEIELAGGKRVEAKVRRFADGHGRAFLAVLRPGAAVLGVRFPGIKVDPGPPTVETPIVSATRQCGYSFSESL